MRKRLSCTRTRTRMAAGRTGPWKGAEREKKESETTAPAPARPTPPPEPGAGTHRGQAGCGGVPAARDVRAALRGLHGRAAVSARSGLGTPTPEAGQLALPGLGPRPDGTLVTAGLGGTPAPGPAPPAPGRRRRQVIFQPVPGQPLLLGDQRCRGRGGLARAPRGAGLGAAALGTAHASHGCPVGRPAGRCHLPVAAAGRAGPGSLGWGRVPRPLLGRHPVLPLLRAAAAAAAGQLVPAPSRPGRSRPCLGLPDPGTGPRGLGESRAGARGRRGLSVK